MAFPSTFSAPSPSTPLPPPSTVLPPLAGQEKPGTGPLNWSLDAFAQEGLRSPSSQPLTLKPEQAGQQAQQRQTTGLLKESSPRAFNMQDLRNPSQSLKQASPARGENAAFLEADFFTTSQTTPKGHTLGSTMRPLLPGVLLRSGRYRLQELLERQDWLSNVFEATWLGRDSQRGGAQVMICEIALPDNTSVMTQSILRTATMALASVGRHQHIPALWDAFSDQGRGFFVFELAEGDSLMTRMRHTGGAMAEQDVVECCLQMTEVLEVLVHQSPSLVHGLIRPEHIVLARASSQYVLTNFSVVLAGGASQYVTGIDRTRLSPYTAPEFVRGVIDVRTDLYALIATAYHVVTGHTPVGPSGSIPSARRLNPGISSEFDAILTKGLRAVPNQRYQRPSELRQDLLAMRSVSGNLVPTNKLRTSAPAASMENGHVTLQSPSAMANLAQGLPITMNVLDDDDDHTALPRPEDLPPLRESNTVLKAVILLGLIITGFVIVVMLSHMLS